MNTDQARCRRCGYRTGNCPCPEGPLVPAPPPAPAAALDGPLMTPAEVAALFCVETKTVTRWAQQGKLASIRTLGGHRRYYRTDVEVFLNTPASRG